MTPDDNSIPTHVGFIVDGNRRWAKQHGIPSYEGHLAGYNTLQDVLLELHKHGVKYVSAYVFSTENWKRSKEEVNGIMKLILRILKNDVSLFVKENVRLRVIGTRDGLSDAVVKAIHDAEEKTKDLTNGEVILCVNYGGQLEITDAVKKIVESGVTTDKITPNLISENLYAPDVPPCDVIVRTSGEERLSNFMLWRAAYSELMFLEKQWPDMTKEDVTAILKEYARRNRRYGK